MQSFLQLHKIFVPNDLFVGSKSKGRRLSIDKSQSLGKV